MLKRLFCRHKEARCVHDREAEIAELKSRKRRVYVYCEKCENYVSRKRYPEICFLTKKEHP